MNALFFFLFQLSQQVYSRRIFCCLASSQALSQQEKLHHCPEQNVTS
jgi:hypothetical protein